MLKLVTEQEPASEAHSEIGHSILERIRGEINHEYGYFQGDEGEDVFRSLYLTPRGGCLPEHLIGDDILLDIRDVYHELFEGIATELKARTGFSESLWLAVDPSYEDSTFCVFCSDERVLLLYWSKAWNFFWPDEEAMATDLGRMYEDAASRLQQQMPNPSVRI